MKKLVFFLLISTGLCLAHTGSKTLKDKDDEPAKSGKKYLVTVKGCLKEFHIWSPKFITWKCDKSCETVCFTWDRDTGVLTLYLQSGQRVYNSSNGPVLEGETDDGQAWRAEVEN
jgi:hypothetical protein